MNIYSPGTRKAEAAAKREEARLRRVCSHQTAPSAPARLQRLFASDRARKYVRQKVATSPSPGRAPAQSRPAREARPAAQNEFGCEQRQALRERAAGAGALLKGGDAAKRAERLGCLFWHASRLGFTRRRQEEARSVLVVTVASTSVHECERGKVERPPRPCARSRNANGRFHPARVCVRRP